LFAIGTRRSPTRLMSEECSYWSAAEERVLGLVFRDTQDDDYGGIDLSACFRPVRRVASAYQT
jgi:hypothetical protein